MKPSIAIKEMNINEEKISLQNSHKYVKHINLQLSSKSLQGLVTKKRYDMERMCK